jgi:hypothetical protein
LDVRYRDVVQERTATDTALLALKKMPSCRQGWE